MEMPGMRDPTRIREACPSVGDPYAGQKRIEDESLSPF